jgi:hypothetical protein
LAKAITLLTESEVLTAVAMKNYISWGITVKVNISFRNNISPPSSDAKNKPIKEPG